MIIHLFCGREDDSDLDGYEKGDTCSECAIIREEKRFLKTPVGRRLSAARKRLERNGGSVVRAWLESFNDAGHYLPEDVDPLAALEVLYHRVTHWTRCEGVYGSWEDDELASRVPHVVKATAGSVGLEIRIDLPVEGSGARFPYKSFSAIYDWETNGFWKQEPTVHEQFVRPGFDREELVKWFSVETHIVQPEEQVA